MQYSPRAGELVSAEMERELGHAMAGARRESAAGQLREFNAQAVV